MNTSTLLAACILLVLVGFGQTVPPKPPAGYKWVRNWSLSDEFFGNALNKNKWMNRHDFWWGRAPTVFNPSTVSVSGGYLRIRNKLQPNPRNGQWIAGGAVMSKTYSAGFGYYETRMKASSIRMSSAFWMQNRMEKLNSTKCWNDRYMQELDIVEAVGGYYGKSSTHMAANTHYRYHACDQNGNMIRKEKFYSRGANMPIGARVNSRFITYGAWWKDGNHVTFYVNDRPGQTVWFRKDIDKTAPFDRKQALIMSCSTYFWLQPYPSKQDLMNAQRSTAMWDWVRSWYLVKA